ncbi:Uncharacterised protein [Escherichia coli]|nr:Uncharacterised protein [Escherichia coli]SQN22684.1 Uncharacterised protein [Escherichia coli]SQO13156.1 Uncharacterised protein [Escherichia coli]SVF15474.1 Uncharacterised protein [Escherichia coli]SVF31575.1 Uncharacterised protein [Escherichia coli]
MIISLYCYISNKPEDACLPTNADGTKGSLKSTDSNQLEVHGYIFSPSTRLSSYFCIAILSIRGHIIFSPVAKHPHTALRCSAARTSPAPAAPALTFLLASTVTAGNSMTCTTHPYNPAPGAEPLHWQTLLRFFSLFLFVFFAAREMRFSCMNPLPIYHQLQG